jgi:SPP1 family predicted phage head-tail adaptor
VTLQEVTMTADAYGAETESWSDVDTVWANVETESQAEQSNTSDAVVGVTSYKFTLRYATDRDVTQRHRLLLDGRTFDIVSALNRDERRRFFEVQAVENSR